MVWGVVGGGGITSRREGRCNGYVKSFNSRIRDKLLNETLFVSMAHAHIEIAV